MQVDEHYWYQLSIDDLPVWGLVGKVMKPNDDPEYLKQVCGAFTSSVCYFATANQLRLHVRIAWKTCSILSELECCTRTRSIRFRTTVHTSFT